MIGILREKLAPVDLSKFGVEFSDNSIKILLREAVGDKESFKVIFTFSIKNGVWLYCLTKDEKWIEKEFNEDWIEEGYNDIKSFLEQDLVCFYTVVTNKCSVAVFRHIMDVFGIRVSKVKYGSYHEELKNFVGSKFVVISNSVVSGMSPFVEMYAQMKDIKYDYEYLKAGEEIKLYVWTENELLSREKCLSDDSEYIDKGFVLSGLDNSKMKIMYGGISEISFQVDYGKRVRFFADKSGVYYIYWADISDDWFIRVPTRRIALFPDMIAVVVV